MVETVRDNVEHHRYELVVGDAMAVSVYRRSGKVTTFIHTEVPASLGGRGVGSQLIRGALDMERASGRKVIAECPFVARFIAQHSEYQDLLSREGKAEAERQRLDAEVDEALEESF